ncbi:Homoserine/homoserine lactone efflux protein [Defluviimonas aquaemixtae]|uniref:Homoserine/homoserine lactone efflux protein n=1 Tax=Albidovulum aquaemixtae TaxID=1542388 RepID=A0A2R8BJM2_9RHOB|nr:LysE family translocator [Defluviimonas aquaemixtae]SPH23579.1 Homoserine/homoserine lactone efflux protein [Defluviimonas aquaemixtae]
MTYEMYPALIALAIGTLFTPGPNNVMLAASGANFGVRRTVPHLLGVATGFPLMLLIVGLILGELFQASALLRETLRWGGAALLLWIAWRIASAGGIGSKSGRVRPMSFMQAVGFQWINPKAWSMAIAATSQFILPSAPLVTAAIVAATFLTLGLGSATTWTCAGQAIARWLTTARRLRFFNIAMAALIVLSVLELLRH